MVEVEDVLLKVILHLRLTAESYYCWYVFYCIVTQAIWCLKFLNMTKCGRTICISVPHIQFWGTGLPSLVIYAHDILCFMLGSAHTL